MTSVRGVETRFGRAAQTSFGYTGNLFGAIE
jgi:hypothetical protein